MRRRPTRTFEAWPLVFLKVQLCCASVPKPSRAARVAAAGAASRGRRDGVRGAATAARRDFGRTTGGRSHAAPRNVATSTGAYDAGTRCPNDHRVKRFHVRRRTAPPCARGARCVRASIWRSTTSRPRVERTAPSLASIISLISRRFAGRVTLPSRERLARRRVKRPSSHDDSSRRVRKSEAHRRETCSLLSMFRNR